MPHIVNLRELQTCLDRSEAMEAILDGPVSEELVHRLGAIGSMQYFPHFPRPYFRIDHPTSWLVQGIVGAAKLRIQLFGSDQARALEALKHVIEDGASKPPPQ